METQEYDMSAEAGGISLLAVTPPSNLNYCANCGASLVQNGETEYWTDYHWVKTDLYSENGDWIYQKCTKSYNKAATYLHCPTCPGIVWQGAEETIYHSSEYCSTEHIKY